MKKYENPQSPLKKDNETVSLPRIVNMVATGRFPAKLDIERLYMELPLDEKEFEPEVYPALLVKVGENRAHVTLYKNGKYIITGVASEKELMEAYTYIYKKLHQEGAF